MTLRDPALARKAARSCDRNVVAETEDAAPDTASDRDKNCDDATPA